jgi:hypothetical protein
MDFVQPLFIRDILVLSTGLFKHARNNFISKSEILRNK